MRRAEPKQRVGTTAVSLLLVSCPRRRAASYQPLPRLMDAGIRVFSCLVFGSSGCGKSTLLAAVAGVDPASARAAIEDESKERDGSVATHLLAADETRPATVSASQG